MKAPELPPECPAAQKKKQRSIHEVAECLKDKTATLSRDHTDTCNKGGQGKRMIMYIDGGSDCHE